MAIVMENHTGSLDYPDILMNDTSEGNLTEAQAGGSYECTGTVFFFIIYGPIWGTICVFGLIGNTLSFVTLSRFTKSNVSTFLLKCLAVMDNIFLASTWVQMYVAMSLYFGLTEQLEPVFPALQTYVWPVVHTVQMQTVWMVVLLAANRYIAVCLPLHAPRLCTKKKVKIQITIMTLGIITYNMPRFFEYNVVMQNVTSPENVTMEMEVNKGLARYQIYNILYENIAYVLFVFLIPLLTLVFFNVHLIRELKKAQKYRKEMTSKSTTEENNITLVMVVIIILYLVCQTPASMNQILFFIVDDHSKMTCSPYMMYYHICNVLMTINSAVNFIVYCVFRRQFQQDLLAMLCCRKHYRLQKSVRQMTSTYHHHYPTGVGRSSTTENVPLTPNSSESTREHSTLDTGPKHNGYKNQWS